MRKLSKGGMTLIEVVVAIAIFGIVMVTIFPAAIMLTLMNKVSYENIDTTFIAQEAIERVIFETRSSTLLTTRQMIQNEMGFTFDSAGSTSTHYRYSRNESNYTVSIQLIRRPNSQLWQLLVVVDSSLADAEGTRTQLETIVSIRDN